MCGHLRRLEEHFATYFPDVDMTKFDWVRDPFHCDAGTVDLPATVVEQLIELSFDKMSQSVSISKILLVLFDRIHFARYNAASFIYD